MDIQFCLDYFAVITYICDYYSKDDSGTLKYIMEALKQVENDGLKNKLKLVVDQFLTHRQIGESEAYYRILPSLHLKGSNTKNIFVPTGFKRNRSTFLQRLQCNDKDSLDEAITIEGKDGYYSEKPSLIDKYTRRDCTTNKELNHLCYAQFAKYYIASRTCSKSHNSKSKDEQQNEEIHLEDDSAIVEGDNDKSSEVRGNKDRIVTCTMNQMESEMHILPVCIKLVNVKPGEPEFMKLRSPMVIKFHKINRSKNPHEHMFSELQLYRPFKSEEELQPEDFEKCKVLYEEKCEYGNDRTKIQIVKKLLMPHLVDVQEGIQHVEETLESNAGALLDPENEQDNADCEDEGVSDHPDFVSKDPSQFIEKGETSRSNNLYKRIEISDEKILNDMTLRLDNEQRRIVEIGVNYAKSLVKSAKSKCAPVDAPFIVVQGGAGSGKSNVIDVLSQRIEKILRKSGDSPEQPYVVKAAFTGTAASNIQGQTLTTAFSLPFGNTSTHSMTRQEIAGETFFKIYQLLSLMNLVW